MDLFGRQAQDRFMLALLKRASVFFEPIFRGTRADLIERTLGLPPPDLTDRLRAEGFVDFDDADALAIWKAVRSCIADEQAPAIEPPAAAPPTDAAASAV